MAKIRPKFKSTFLIQRMNGTTYDLGKMGIRVRSFDPPSPSYQHTFQQVGKYNTVLTDTKVSQLVIPFVFDMYANDNYDYELQRMQVSKVFESSEPFYIINLRIPFLRWRVVADAFSVQRLDNYWKASSISVNLNCIDGYAQTIATTLDDIKNNGNKWGLGIGFPKDKAVKYKFKNETTFEVFNASIIPLLADDKPVKIKFNGTVKSDLKIENQTTGQTFEFKKPLSKSETLIIDGLMPTVDNKNRYADSNHAYLDFATQFNQIKITGASDFTISFETRFYY